jgi:thiol:disulfide interchange protein DsbD
MRHLLKALLCLFAMTSVVPAAQKVPATEATLSLWVSEGAATSTEPFWAAVQFELNEHWHIYWKNPGDSGLEPTLNWTLPKGYSAGPVHYAPPSRVNLSGIYSYAYENEATLLIPVTPPADAKGGTIAVQVEYLICKDVCIPGNAELSVDLADAENPGLIEAAQDSLPKPFAGEAWYQRKGGMVELHFPGITDFARAQWWPLTDGIITNADAQQIATSNGELVVVAPAGYKKDSPDFEGVLEIADGTENRQAWQVTATLKGAAVADAAVPPVTPQPVALGLLSALMLAFVGGLILNIMPCVLPVLSLKALSLAKKADSEAKKVRREGLAYTAGILVSFVALAGALIAFKQAGHAVGWGFQLQEPGFVAILAYILFLVGLNLSGLFEISGRFTGAGSRYTAMDGTGGAFFTGVLATLVATPCSAPFMATALGFAFTQPPVISLLIFLSLGLGLAFPLLLISLVPAARHLLPRPGNWMVRFRQFLAFPMYASVIWLLWVLVQQSGADGLLYALAGMLVIAFILWAMQVAGGVFKLLWLLAGIALLWATVDVQKAAPVNAVAAGEDSHVQVFSQELVDDYRAQGKPVFVVGTAAWCITCKVNERNALKDEAVLSHVQENDIQYLVADWTNYNEPIRQYLESFGRNGVPIYVWYPPQGEPQILPQLLTPSLVVESLQ